MRAKNINKLSVASILFLTIACTTVPARADVNITAAQVGDPFDGRVIISFDATSETNLVRAFSFDIRLDNDSNIVSVTGLSADYWLYPGTIQIAADGTITSYGTIAAEYGDLPGDTLPGPPDGNGVTLEAASLYAPVGPGSPNAPAKSGDLVEVRIGVVCDPFPTNTGCAPVIPCSTCLTISANVARAGPTGVVMEDPDEVVVVNFTGVCIDIPIPPEQCLLNTDPGYLNWIELDCPACWCYRHQCQGDADGLATFNRYVALSDLNILKAEFGKTITELQNAGRQGCADFDHLTTFGRPVALSDLNILKVNFGVMGLPDCPMTHINYWEEP